MQDNHAQNSGVFGAQSKNSQTAPARFMIKTDNKGNQYVQADRKVITGDDPEVWKTQITQYINDVIRQGKDLQIKTIEGDTVTITKNTAGKAAFQNKDLNEEGFKTKLNAEAHIDELSEISRAQRNLDGTKKITPDHGNKHAKRNLAKDGWSYRTAYFKDFSGKVYKVQLSVAMDGTVESIYNVGKIKEKHLPGESRLMPQRATSASTNSIRQENENVNSFSKKSTENVSKGENHNKDAYSASLQGRKSELAYAPASTANDNARQTMQTMTLLTDGRVEIVLTNEDILTADGQKANGAYIDGVLYLNANASSYKKAMFVASHELVHTLEGTKAYEALGEFIEERIKGDERLSKKYNVLNYVIAYANAQSREYSAETKLYEATTEMYADFVANEVLSNEATVRRLVNRNRNVVVRMLTWVRSAVKRLGMSKTEREAYDTLRKTEKLLANALEKGNGGVSLDEVEERLQASEKETAEESTARYSIKNVDGKDIVVVDTDQDIFEGAEETDYPKIVRQYMLNKFKNQVLPIGDSKAYVNRDQIREYTYPANRRMDGDLKTAKMRAGTELDNLLRTAEYVKHEDDDGRHPEAVRGWDKYKTKFIVNGRMFEGEVSLDLMERGNLFYDLGKIKDITPGTNGSKLPASRRSDVVEENISSTNSIRENLEKSTQNAKKVEKNFSGRASLDVDINQESVYNGENGGIINEREETRNSRQGTRTEEVQRENRNYGRRGVISVFDDSGTIRGIREITQREETLRQIEKFAQEIYTNPRNYTQEDLQGQAENEGIKLYFAKRAANANNFYIFENDNLIIDENATEEQLGNILNIEKPIIRNVDNSKIAKISGGRWNSFLSWKPHAYLTQIPIQDFLDMTTTSKGAQRSIYGLAKNYEERAGIESIKNSYRDAIYLEIDFEQKKVVNHEGRHRLMELLNAGYAHAQIFVIPTQKTDFESAAGLEIEGQFNGEKYSLGLVRANSDRFSAAIEQVFRRNDKNVRYSLDSAEYMTDEEYEATLAETELIDDGSVANIQRVTERKAKLTKEQLIQSVKTRVADSKLRVQMETTNVQAGIEKAAKRLGEDVEAKIQKARSAPSAALNMITNEQRDYSGKKKVGKSLTERADFFALSKMICVIDI